MTIGVGQSVAAGHARSMTPLVSVYTVLHILQAYIIIFVCLPVLTDYRTRKTPIGVVLREPQAVNHLVVHIHFLVRELSEIGTTRAGKVMSSDSPPSICYNHVEFVFMSQGVWLL